MLLYRVRIYLISSFVSLGGFMYGYGNGALTACLVIPAFREQFSFDTPPERPVTVVTVTVALAASFLASMVAGFLADGIGRKKLFYVAAAIDLVGGIIQVAGFTLGMLITGRIITGLAIGIFSMLVPLYQSEIAQAHNRGRLITLYQFGITLGFFIAYWVSYGTYDLPGPLSWRVTVGLQIVPAGLMLIGLFAIPESPRWLIFRGRHDEALRILSRLRNNQCDERDMEVQMEFTSVVQDVSYEKVFGKKNITGLTSTVGIDNYRKRTVLGIGIHTFNQLSGINALLFYLPYVLESAGIEHFGPILLIGNGIVGAINFISTIPAFMIIDRVDRRKILVYGALAMGVCMIAVAGVSGAYNPSIGAGEGPFANITLGITNRAAMIIVLVLMGIFVASFAMSWGTVGWVYPAEIYPQLIRANAMGITTSVGYFWNALVTAVSPLMLRYMLWGTYLFFGCICLIMAWISHRYYPETKGRSLEEINLIFSGALLDQRPGAHHPATAAEALIHLEQVRYQEQRKRLARAGSAAGTNAGSRAPSIIHGESGDDAQSLTLPRHPSDLESSLRQSLDKQRSSVANQDA